MASVSVNSAGHGCVKKCFVTRKQAKAEMKKRNKSGKLDRPLTNVYYCENCLHYHLTSYDVHDSRNITRKITKRNRRA